MRASRCTIRPRRTCACCGAIWSKTDGRSASTPTRRACFKRAPKIARDMTALARDALAGGFAELCRNPASSQRLHHPVRQQDLPDCAHGCSCRIAGIAGSQVRVEVRLDDSLAVRFGNHYLTIAECHGRPPREAPVKVLRKPTAPRQKIQWMKNFRFPGQEKTAFSAIPSAYPASTPKSNL